MELIKVIPVHVALEKVDIWFQDAARFGQQNTTTQLWGTKGNRPIAVKQQQFEYAGYPMPICLVRYARQREKRKP
jgi:hypothetical protein